MTLTPADVASALGPLFSLEGNVALVTGAGVGMGTVAARAMSSVGATVILAEEQSFAASAADIAHDIGAEAMIVDVTSEASVTTLFEGLHRNHGRLDILVNAVTCAHNKPTLEISIEEWDEVQAINLRSAFLTTRAAVPLMRRAGGGRIINLTTIGSKHPVLHGNAAYSSSKAGLNMFTLTCALDFASDGIMVNAVLPGAIITEKIDTNVKYTGPGADPARHLSGYGKSADIAGLILLLAGPAGRFITGQQIAVDGGFQVS